MGVSGRRLRIPGSQGIKGTLRPSLSADEEEGLKRNAKILQEATRSISVPRSRCSALTQQHQHREASMSVIRHDLTSVYLTIQDTNWVRTAQAIGHPEWAEDPAYATPEARQPHIFDIFAEIEKWLSDKSKYEAVNILRKYGIPSAPVFSMKELENDPDLRANGTIVEVPHTERGSYTTIGSVMKFSTFTPKVTASPLLGEHTDEVLASLGYGPEQIAKLHAAKAVDIATPPAKPPSRAKAPPVPAK
jgi:hypothetical protein